MKKTLYILKNRGIEVCMIDTLVINLDINGWFALEIDNMYRNIDASTVQKIVLNDKVLFEAGEFNV